MQFFPWYTTTMLALESRQVIALRLMKLGDGGPAAIDEAILMVCEKVDAGIAAGITILSGGSIASIVQAYRLKVAANAGRLCDTGQQPRIRLPLKLVVRD
jgi:hypothetical protein